MAAQHRHELDPGSELTDPVADSSPGEVSDPGRRPPRYLTVAEVAGLLRVSTMTVYRQIQAGELPAVRVGKSYRLKAVDVDDWIAECVVPRPPEA